MTWDQIDVYASSVLRLHKISCSYHYGLTNCQLFLLVQKNSSYEVRSISVRIIWFSLTLIDKIIQYWVWVYLFLIRGNAINRTLFLILTTINVLTKPLLYFKKSRKKQNGKKSRPKKTKLSKLLYLCHRGCWLFVYLIPHFLLHFVPFFTEKYKFLR